LRSPTAERVFFGTPGLEVRSAGTERDAEVVVSGEDVDWADVVFVMEPRHRKRLDTIFGKGMAGKRVVVLGIPDDFEFMQPELIALLEAKLEPFLGRITHTSVPA
jgi:predicted protein tyrosine phosphatase